MKSDNKHSMQRFFSYIQTPQRALALLFLLLFPFSTVFIYSERFVNGYKWEYGTLAYYGIELIGWALIGSLLIPLAKKAKGTKFHITADRLFFGATFLFLLYSVASAFWAIDSALAQQQTTLVLLMFLIFLSLPMVLTRQEIIAAFSIGAVLPIGIGMYQFFAQELFGSVWLGISGRAVADAGVSIVQSGEGRWLRAYGTFAHPNIFGGYLVVVIMSMLYGLGGDIGVRLRRWYVVMLCVSGFVLVLTMSRSAWFAAFLGMIMMMGLCWCRFECTTRRTIQSGLILFGVGVTLACIVTLPLLSVRFSGSTHHEVVSIRERVTLQEQAIAVWQKHPIVGVGAGNMTAATIADDPDQPGYVYQPVHNVPLLLVVEYGVVGLLLLGVALSYLGRSIVVQRTYVALVGAIILLPLLLLDHYLWTSVHGLGIVAVYLAILLYPNNSSRGI